MSYAILDSDGKVLSSNLSESNLPAKLKDNQTVSYRGHVYNTIVSLVEIGPGAQIRYEGATGKITRCADPDNAFWIEASSGSIADMLELMHRLEKKLGFIDINLADES